MALGSGYGGVIRDPIHKTAEFLQAHTYTHLIRWLDEINEREAIKRGQTVHRPFGDKPKQLLERHDASDFELPAQDILDPDPPEDKMGRQRFRKAR
jgi:GST-like protein